MAKINCEPRFFSLYPSLFNIFGWRKFFTTEHYYIVWVYVDVIVDELIISGYMFMLLSS